MKNLNWQSTLLAMLLVGAGAIAGANLTSTNQAQAEVRGSNQEQPSFQSGGQMSVPILREISATLKVMDARLARLETSAKKIEMSAGKSTNTAALRVNPADTQ